MFYFSSAIKLFMDTILDYIGQGLESQCLLKVKEDLS